MNEESIIRILKDLRLPAYEEIPDVGLYLDQVVKYINSFLSDFPEMNVTPSMITNYVKLKLIRKPIKKVYSRGQISGFIFIVCVKSVLSMDHIRECLKLVSTFESSGHAYVFFRERMNHALQSFENANIPLIGKTENEVETALQNIVVAVAHKMYLDRYFEHRKAIELIQEIDNQ